MEVTPASATVTTGSAEKKYDGTPLNGSDLPDSGASITGLASADESQVTVTATGSITDVGTAENTYSIDWGSAKSSNYTLSETLGTLEITANDTEITFTSASAEKVYDGTPLIAHDVTVEGLPDGLSYKCTAGNTFSAVDAGTYSNYFDDMEYTSEDDEGNPIVGWRYAVIYDADGNDVTDKFTNINLVTGTLTITPAELVVKTGSAEKKYDGTPLTSTEASISGLVSADEGQVSVTANGTITDAGSQNNTYSIDWGSANSSNYTVSEQVGILTVDKLPIEFNLYFPKEIIDDVETDPTFVYDGYARSPEWSTASYEGMEEGLDPDAWDLDDSGESYSFIFLLPGGAEVRLIGSGYSDAGKHSFEPAATFLEGNRNNYELSFINNSIVIEPVQIVLISDDTYAVTSDVYISEYGLKVQVNNLSTYYYEVISTGENEWQISFDWGDKINVGKLLLKDGYNFSITPVYDFAPGNPDNYDIDTVDQEGTMVDPAYIDSDGLYGSMLMRKASSLFSVTAAEDDADTDDSGKDSEENPDSEENSGEDLGDDSEEDPDEDIAESADAGSTDKEISADPAISIDDGSSDEEISADQATSVDDGSSDEEIVADPATSVDDGSSDEETVADPAASASMQEDDELLEEESLKEELPADEPWKEDLKAEEPQEEEAPL